jgi:uncharacterized protein (UPF0147 family)
MDDIIATLQEALDDESTPKVVRAKLEDLIALLQGPGDDRLKASKALSELDSLCDSTGLPSFIRTQLWNVSSMLERV